MESLESRQLLAAVVWDGGPAGTGTAFSDPVNWVGDIKPGANDDAIINAPGGSISLNVSESVRSIVSVRTISQSGGTLTVAAASTLSGYVLTNGTLTGAGGVEVTSAFTWSGGTISGTGSLTVSAGATGTINGASAKTLLRNLFNHGTVNYSGTNLVLGSGAVTGTSITNQTTATWNITAAGSFTAGAAGSQRFTNDGTLNKSATGASAFTGVVFDNNGAINLTAGTLNLPSGISSGPIVVSAGTVLSLSGTRSHTAGAISGAGNLQLAGTLSFADGTLSHTGNTSISAGTHRFSGANSLGAVTFSGGVIGGAGALTVTRSLTWSGGVMTEDTAGSGKTVIPSGSILSLPATANARVLARALEVGGTINQTATASLASQLTLGSSTLAGAVSLLAGGTWNLTGGTTGVLLDSAAPDGSAVEVSGTLNKTDASTTTIAPPLDLLGTAMITAGTLSLQRPGDHSGTFQLSSGAQLQVADTHTFVAGGIRGVGALRISGELFLGEAVTAPLEIASLNLLNQQAKLHLSDNDLVLNYTGISPMATIISAWNSGAITTNADLAGQPTYLALANSVDLGLTEFANIVVDPTTIVGKFTYVGDANLDGLVDALDYERVDLSIGNVGTQGPAQGDLNYDSRVDALDYEAIDLNVGNGVGAPLAGKPSQTAFVSALPTPTGKTPTPSQHRRLGRVWEHQLDMTTLPAGIDAALQPKQVE